MDNNLPADCQGNDSRFPWNQEDFEGEPQSKGSECCGASVQNAEGFLICSECGYPAEEQFETDEEMCDRVSKEEAEMKEEMEISRGDNQI